VFIISYFDGSYENFFPKKSKKKRQSLHRNCPPFPDLPAAADGKPFLHNPNILPYLYSPQKQYPHCLFLCRPDGKPLPPPYLLFLRELSPLYPRIFLFQCPTDLLLLYPDNEIRRQSRIPPIFLSLR